MDGVIIDSEPIHQRIEDEMFRELGLMITDEEHQSFVGTTTSFMWEMLIEKYRLPYTPLELVEEGHRRFFNKLSTLGEVQPMPGLMPFLKRLKDKGIRTAVASSSSRKLVEPVLMLLGVRDYFELLVCGDDVERGKPEPDIFLRAAAIMDVLPEECIVIEDSENGVKAAKAAGMRCIGFKNPNSGKQDLSRSDVVIEGFFDLTDEMLQSLFKG